MNEIGSVEFETHVPLFFDPYTRNRTTGSFILIDAATNATVGAGMIQEDAPAATVGSEKEFTSYAALETPVAAEERYARHGHFPAVLLFEGRPELAVRLERLLFERGFEVLHPSGPEFSGDTFAETVRVTQQAGILVLYSGEALSKETKHRLTTEFSHLFFDLASAAKFHGSEEQIARHVLARAESLWLVDEPRKNQGRVN